MNGWRYLGTIGPGGGQLAGEQGHNDYLVMPDLTNYDAPRRRTVHRSQFHSGRARKVTGGTLPMWLPHEVEACRSFGAAAYACMAADCDQVRELLAVEEAKAAMEVWRLSNGEWLDWHTDSDAAGAEARETQEYRKDMLARWTLWLAALTPPAEGATLGDWAAAQPEPPMKWSREYMQHLYDKLAKDGEIGG